MNWGLGFDKEIDVQSEFKAFKTVIWGMGLHGVVASLARRKTDGFDSHMFQSLDFRNRHEVSDG